jgi:hypothetical protein
VERENLLTVLSTLLAGSTVTLSSVLPPARDAKRAVRRSGLELERRAWWRLHGPFFAGLVVFAGLVGWALREPDSGENAPYWLIVAAAPFAVLWLRGLVRALRSLRKARRPPLVHTSGLWRPRPILSPAFAVAAEPAVLEAACAHERAHAAHRDPLRIWLAQLVADLQWPLPSARLRYRAWREALEWARDDEARAAGAQGADLAAAILLAARLELGGSFASEACLACSPAPALRSRIGRLLAPAESTPASNDLLRRAILVGALVSSLAVGDLLGPGAIRWMLGLF